MPQVQVVIPPSAKSQEYVIMSCFDKLENIPCPCHSSHLLHYRKEPLVYYQEKVWGINCAIEDLRLEALNWKNRHETTIENYIKDTEELRQQLLNKDSTNKELSRRVGRLAETLKNYTFHLEGCEIVEDAACGRIIDSKCTCGYADVAESVEERSFSWKQKL